VATELSKDDMRRFARLGAMKRLDDIRREEAAIRASFPELFAGDRPVRAVTAGKAAKPARGAKPAKAAKAAKAAKVAAGAGEAKSAARKRSTMSPAMRKEVSERMKKYWAGRRKSKNG